MDQALISKRARMIFREKIPLSFVVRSAILSAVRLAELIARSSSEGVAVGYLLGLEAKRKA